MVSTLPAAMAVAGVVGTVAGMHVLWTPMPARPWRDLANWQRDPAARSELRWMLRHGVIAPIAVQLNGAFAFAVRVGTEDEPAQLTEREDDCRALISAPYLIRTAGRLFLSGVEQLHTMAPTQSLRLDVPAGDYAATVHLIDVDLDPDSRAADGNWRADALPDFVLTLQPVTSAINFRHELATFG
jgi:hypothetical protein